MIKNSKYDLLVLILIFILLLPALLINLGMNPLIADEATRAVVSMEMEFSGNLVTPTINGEFYYNKPPVYNWILLSVFKITGGHSEWIIRIPTVIFLLLFGLLIWQSARKHIGNRPALISALAFITCGRILFYDSMLGLIDISFSMLVFLNFVLIYHYLKKEKYLPLFILSYLLAAVTFLMKGLPALVFQTISLFVALLFFKKWKKLFHPAHFLGILFFFILTGSYYFLALKINPEGNYFNILVSESTKRTFMEYGWLKTFGHLFSFPFEQLIHLFPWSILFVFLFQKTFYQNIRNNHFLSFLSLIFIANIPVYWISVETYPRYLFMLYPILLILLVNHFCISDLKNPFRKYSGYGIFLAGILAIAAGSWYFFSYDFIVERKWILIYVLSLVIASTIIFAGLKFPQKRLEILILLMLTIRLGFSLFIIPEKSFSGKQDEHRQQAITAARLSGEEEIRTVAVSPLSLETVYYIMKEKEEIVPMHKGKPEPGACYIFDNRNKAYEGEEVLFVFETRWENSPVRLSRIH